jgi:hypothetical protein
VDFPDEITFTAVFEHGREIEEVELVIEYPIVRSCVERQLMSTRITAPEDDGRTYKWVWEMKKTGSIPPGTAIEFTWMFTDDGEELYVFDPFELEWSDRAYVWESYEIGNLTIDWHTGISGFGEDVYNLVIGDIERLELNAEITTPI